MVKKYNLFEREISAFTRLMPPLLENYPDKYVAIYQEEVIASGDKKLQLFHQVQKEYGCITCYIEKVAPEYPQTARIPSVRIVSSISSSTLYLPKL